MICLIREIEGVHGVHIMAYRQEYRVAEIVETTGILQGRTPWHPAIARQRDSHPSMQHTGAGMHGNEETGNWSITKQ